MDISLQEALQQFPFLRKIRDMLQIFPTLKDVPPLVQEVLPDCIPPDLPYKFVVSEGSGWELVEVPEVIVCGSEGHEGVTIGRVFGVGPNGIVWELPTRPRIERVCAYFGHELLPKDPSLSYRRGREVGQTMAEFEAKSEAGSETLDTQFLVFTTTRFGPSLNGRSAHEVEVVHCSLNGPSRGETQ